MSFAADDSSRQPSMERLVARQLLRLDDRAAAEAAVRAALAQVPWMKELRQSEALTQKLEASWRRWRRRGTLTPQSHALRTAQLLEATFGGPRQAGEFSLFLQQQQKMQQQQHRKRLTPSVPSEIHTTNHHRTVSPIAPPKQYKTGTCKRVVTPPVTAGSKRGDTTKLAPTRLPMSSQTKAAAVISDTETTSERSVEQELCKLDFWYNFLEALRLQVCSRTTNVWGRKRTYEIFRLAGPCRRISPASAGILQRELAQQFLQNVVRECRVYTQHQNDEVLWIQINIGRPLDHPHHRSTTATSSSSYYNHNNHNNEFVAMVVPDSNLVALTASRAASRSLYTPYVLLTLETTLTCSVVGGYAPRANAQRVHALSGTEPSDLVRTARAMEAADAVGRFASLGTSTDPITDLQRAAAGNLLQFRTSTTTTTQSPTSVTVDRTRAEQREHTRQRRDELGNNVDCPKRQCIKWDWKGETPLTGEFKCRVTFKGTDVLRGMQVLMDEGILKGPLPHYMRDAPMMGGNITVKDGKVQQPHHEKL